MTEQNIKQCMEHSTKSTNVKFNVFKENENLVTISIEKPLVGKMTMQISPNGIVYTGNPIMIAFAKTKEN